MNKKTYWMRSESLADSTVKEVVTEFGGQILFHRNANWKIELPEQAADEINRRYDWQLS
jgi:hypothetical protein